MIPKIPYHDPRKGGHRVDENLERRVYAAWDRIYAAIEGALGNEERDVLSFLHHHAHTPDIVSECAAKVYDRKRNSEHSEPKGRS